jgi:hypothetical protein
VNDATAILQKIRSLTGPDHELAPEDVDYLIELVRKLDAAMSRGEASPKPWASGEKVGMVDERMTRYRWQRSP